MASISILGLIGFLAACLFVAGFVHVRRRQGLGLLLVGTGLALAAGTVFWLAPQWLDDHTARATAPLRAELASAHTSRTSVESRLAAATDLARQVEVQHTATLDGIERALAEVHRQYRRGDRDVHLQAPARETAAMAKVDAIASRVEDLRHLKAIVAAPVVRIEPAAAEPARVEPVRAEPARVEPARDLARLRDRLAQPIKTENYDIEPYPGRELVGGRQGRYYVVDIKNAASGIRYYFDGGKYVLKTGQTAFRTSLNSFVGDILNKLDGPTRYELFVRGSADAKPFEGRIDAAHPYAAVTYLKQASNDRYSGLSGETRIERGIVRNTDLPNLRAAFMRDLVADTYPVKPPIILEGAVTPQTSDRDRNVELILFVDW